MKGRTRTVPEKLYHDALANTIGCIACRKDGYPTSHYVSIHHIDGRTKSGCHKKVLPLCAQHHQHDDSDPAGRVGVHPWTARFEARYGKQMDLNNECNRILIAHGYTVGWL